MQLTAQTGNDLASELRFGATIADCRKRFSLFREFLNRLLYLVEIWMRLSGHDSTNISASSRKGLQQVYHSPHAAELRQIIRGIAPRISELLAGDVYVKRTHSR